MKLIPASFNDSQTSDKLRKLIALPWKPGSMRIINLMDNANKKYKNYFKWVNKVKSSTIQQGHRYRVSENEKKINHCYRRSQWWNKKYALLILWKNASNENKIKWYFTRTTIFELINNVEKLEI